MLSKERIHWQDSKILNIHAANTESHTLIEETLLNLKPLIDPSTLIVGAFNNPLSPKDRLSKNKVNSQA